jgi:hypothetical protein
VTVASVEDLLAARDLGAGAAHVAVTGVEWERVTQRNYGYGDEWQAEKREPVKVIGFVSEAIVIRTPDGLIDWQPYGWTVKQVDTNMRQRVGIREVKP